MDKTKRDALLELKARVEKEGVIRDAYRIEKYGMTCHCSVGHLLDICGVDMDKLEMEANRNPVTNLVNYHYDEFFKPLEDAGFTEMELTDLQEFNDRRENTTEDVLAYIDEMLQGVPV